MRREAMGTSLKELAAVVERLELDREEASVLFLQAVQGKRPCAIARELGVTPKHVKCVRARITVKVQAYQARVEAERQREERDELRELIRNEQQWPSKRARRPRK